MKTTYKTGQAALIIVLMMVVVLTLAVATVNRTLTDVKIAQQSEASAKAVAAADAAVEIALNDLNNQWNGAGGSYTASVTTPTPLPNLTSGVSYTYSIDPLPLPVTGGEYQIDTFIPNGDSRTIWLVDDTFDPINATSYYSKHFSVKWSPNTATVGLTLLYKIGGTSDIGIKRYIIGSGTDQKDFADGELTLGNPANQPILLKIKPLNGNYDGIYSPTLFGYDTDFPRQGFLIHAKGLTTLGIQREVEYTVPMPELPGIFDYVLIGDTIKY
jgi:hypothetical protein